MLQWILGGLDCSQNEFEMRLAKKIELSVGLLRFCLRFSSHGRCNISHGYGQTCFYFYQAHYRAYVHKTIYIVIYF